MILLLSLCLKYIHNTVRYFNIISECNGTKFVHFINLISLLAVLNLRQDIWDFDQVHAFKFTQINTPIRKPWTAT